MQEQGEGEGQGQDRGEQASRQGQGGSSQGRGASGAGTPGGGSQRGFTLELDPADAADAADAIDSVIVDLDAAGVDPLALDRLRASAEAVRAGDGSINAARVEAEFRQILRQIEQIELQLTDNAAVDTGVGEEGVARQRVSESAADYYRRLSEQPERLLR